jgi:hypothetical protein
VARKWINIRRWSDCHSSDQAYEWRKWCTWKKLYHWDAIQLASEECAQNIPPGKATIRRMKSETSSTGAIKCIEEDALYSYSITQSPSPSSFARTFILRSVIKGCELIYLPRLQPKTSELSSESRPKKFTTSHLNCSNITLHSR